MFSRAWIWTACGKHPAARDYFKIGAADPLFSALSTWAEAGFQSLNREKHHTTYYSWRFWIKGPQKNVVICGVILDSGDKLGRPYPFLIMGKGSLKKWEKNWDIMPFACDSVWKKMEAIGTGRFTELKKVEDELERLKPPEAGWREWRSANEADGAKASSDMDRALQRMSRNREMTIIPLTGSYSEEVEHWLFEIRKQMGEVPSAVFIGGLPEMSYLVIFRRPLAANDFMTLWSEALKGKYQNGSVDNR